MPISSCEPGPSSARNWRSRSVALRGTKLPMVEPGKKPSFGRCSMPPGKRERPREIGDDRDDLDRREALLQVGRRSARDSRRRCRPGHRRRARSPRAGSASWSPSRRRTRRLPRPSATRAATSGMMSWKNRGFGPRRIIRREPRDLVEQLRPAQVVEPARRDRRDRRATARRARRRGTPRVCGIKRLEQGEPP